MHTNRAGEFPGFGSIAPRNLRDNEGSDVRDKYPDVRDNERIKVQARQSEKTGHGGGGDWKSPPLVPFAQPVSRCDVPLPFAKRQERRAAFAAWQAEGAPWPPPAGLASACLERLTRRHRNGW
jgi:hypothetical protein